MSTSIYDESYHKRFVERAHTELGKQIYKARWDFINRHVGEQGLTLLDYGCGPGAFHESGPAGFDCFGYDINPHCGFPELPEGRIDIATMWDSIEHIYEPLQVLVQLNAEYLFISTPNLESVNEPVAQWRHYRPGEHLYYFDQYSLSELLGSIGYEILEFNFEEGALRDPSNPEAIISCAARRVGV